MVLAGCRNPRGFFLTLFNTMRSTLLAMTATIAFLSVAPSQQLASYDPFAMMISEAQPWTPMIPGPGIPTNVYPAVPMPPPAVGVVLLPGDSSWDGINGLHWLCNGMMLASQPTTLFPPLAPPTPPFPIAPLVMGMLGGPVTGIAYDSAANVLYLCSIPGLIVGVTPIPGTPVVVPPFPIMFPTGPIAGLEWDGMTGTFLCVDIVGIVYPFLPGGFPAGPPIVPAIAFPPPVGDVCIDKSGQLNAIGVRAIHVVGGPMIADVTLPFPLPFPAGPAMNVGLSYLGAPASNPPGVGAGCVCPTFAPGPNQFVTSVMSSGNAGFRVGIGGVPPGQLVLFAFGFVFNPAWPMINATGCPLGFILGGPPIITALGVANATGTATFPLALTVPPGFGAIYNQNFTFCPADPAGFVITPMQSIWASGF